MKPLVTEKMTKMTSNKTYKVKGGEKLNKYGFIVRPEANKIEIKKEVESLYNVTVLM
jgi:large subunit ribosomal protein L23